MSDTQYPTAERSALFIQKSFGGKPAFRGMHGFTGDMTKNDGDRTPVYYYLAGKAVKVATSRGEPQPVTLGMDAPLTAIADLVGTPQECPLDMILIGDICLTPEQKMSWGRWGSQPPALMLLIPGAYIQQRGMSNLLSREGGNAQLVMGNVQLQFDDWKVLRGNSTMSLTTIVADTTVVGVDTTACTGCLDAECGGEVGCQTWYAAAANGDVMKSVDGGVNWTDASPGTAWTAGDSIYADSLVILAGGNDGAADDYGVKRSTDGGTTWTEVVFATAAALKTGTVSQILRYADDFFAFTALGIYRSINDGLTWTLVDATEGFLRCAMDENGFGVAVTAAALYYTTNGGLNWSELTDNPGSAMKGVALAGGYVHVVDSTAGYFRSTIPNVKVDAAVWETMDATAAITDIMFCSRMMGYRLRGTAVDRTVNGGYSWDAISVSGSAPTFTSMNSCAGRLAPVGGVYFGYFDPYFTTSSYSGAAGDCGC